LALKLSSGKHGKNADVRCGKTVKKRGESFFSEQKKIHTNIIQFVDGVKLYDESIYFGQSEKFDCIRSQLFPDCLSVSCHVVFLSNPEGAMKID